MRLVVLLPMVALACGQDRIEVSHDKSNDYNNGALQAAVDGFVKAGRTHQAYGELAKTVLELRPGMDRATAEQAELKLTVLALGPMQAYSTKPIAEQIDALALTVWPTLLADPIEADEILRRRNAKSADVLPQPGELPATYIERLCGKQLAAECKDVVPEFQAEVLSALATRHATERVRIAVADCLLCSTDRGWSEAVRGWETLDRVAASQQHDIDRKSDPANWPIAGAASEKDPGLPEAEVTSTGELIIGGQRYGATTRIEALRDLRFMHGESSPIALHIQPDLELVKVKAILTDVRKSGAKKIAVVARGTHYPWERRIYWLADNAGTRAGLRPTDSIQLLLHAVDHLAGPGSVARVD
ncbi:MAG: hypothetical protein ABI867_39215 [Kofleriaceae bacterium]